MPRESRDRQPWCTEMLVRRSVEDWDHGVARRQSRQAGDTASRVRAISQIEGGEEKKHCSDVQEMKEFLTQPQSFNVLCLSGF